MNFSCFYRHKPGARVEKWVEKREKREKKEKKFKHKINGGSKSAFEFREVVTAKVDVVDNVYFALFPQRLYVKDTEKVRVAFETSELFSFDLFNNKENFCCIILEDQEWVAGLHLNTFFRSA